MFQEFLNVSSCAKVNLTQSTFSNGTYLKRNKSLWSDNAANTIRVEDLLAKQQYIKDCLKPLVEKSKELAEQAEKRAENCSDLSLQMISLREDMYRKIEFSEQDKNQLISKMEGYEAKKKALLDEEYKLYQELDAERKRIEKDVKAVKKWCWVPGYNLYLYVDAKEELARYGKKIDSVNHEKLQLQNAIDALNQQISEMSGSADNMERKIRKYTESIALLAEKISYYNSLTFQFNEFYYQYNILYKSVGLINDRASILKAVNEADKVISELSQKENEIQKQFEEDMKNIERIIASTYRGNVLYRGQTIQYGEYLASLNKRFIATLTYDGRFVVRNFTKELAVVSEGVQEIVFAQDGTICFGGHHRKNAEVLIMQDDGNLVLYDCWYKPLWATDTWKLGSMASKPFFVPLLTYEGVYRIESQNAMYFDITDHSFHDGAKLQLYYDSNVDNQMFRFEKMENGAYKITAIHSNKCLTVCDEDLADEASIIQSDYCGKKNQLFWVLPSREGCVKFVAVHSSKVLDVKGGNFQNFTPVQQYFENGTKAQTFRLVKVDEKQ